MTESAQHSLLHGILAIISEPEMLFFQVRPIISSSVSTIIHLGPVGSATITKVYCSTLLALFAELKAQYYAHFISECFSHRGPDVCGPICVSALVNVNHRFDKVSHCNYHIDRNQLLRHISF